MDNQLGFLAVAAILHEPVRDDELYLRVVALEVISKPKGHTASEADLAVRNRFDLLVDGDGERPFGRWWASPRVVTREYAAEETFQFGQSHILCRARSGLELITELPDMFANASQYSLCYCSGIGVGPEFVTPRLPAVVGLWFCLAQQIVDFVIGDEDASDEGA